MPEHGAWRSPPPQQTHLVESGSLPAASPMRMPTSPVPGKDVLHPAFLPPCEHADGDMHAHAFDLLSLSGASPVPTRSDLPSQSSSTAVPASVPSKPTSVLSATRPPSASTTSAGSGPTPKARRMSSSTTGVLGRGKLGATGESSLGLGGMGSNGVPRSTLSSIGTSYNASSPIPNRRPSVANSGATGTGTSPTPLLYDFAKTDNKPAARRISTSAGTGVAASLPTRTHLLAQGRHVHPPPSSTPLGPVDDMELDMAFDGDEEGEDERSGSAEADDDMDEDGEGNPEWKKLALGTGSGGVKGRRKGMVFKCENCSKEYRHPSCLVKHRWEHSPHWKEPTQLSMSKHQQVQILEAAAILAHLDPSQGALPNDKSLWPAVLSPPAREAFIRRPSLSASRDPSSLRSPSSSTAPLTPSSLRETSTLASLHPKVRRQSPDSDSTTSSMDGYPGHPNAHGLNGLPSTRPVGIGSGARSYSISSANGGFATPQSVGSLPSEMAGLHFQSGSYTSANNATSPIPNRNGNLPLSLKARAGLVGGGMFGAIHTARPSSSVRSGVLAEDDEEGENERGGRLNKSSSEEADERRKGREGEEWGMAMEMEL